MQLLKNTKYKKKRINNFKNTKYKKKIRTQNFKNTIYKEKTNSKISQRANPVFTVEIRKQIAKKIQNQQLVFSKPCNSDFVFLICLFFVFFLFLNMGRRPFCSHRGLLKYNLFALETFKRSTNFQWGSPLGCLSDLSGFGSPGALRFSRIDRALEVVPQGGAINMPTTFSLSSHCISKLMPVSVVRSAVTTWAARAGPPPSSKGAWRGVLKGWLKGSWRVPPLPGWKPSYPLKPRLKPPLKTLLKPPLEAPLKPS